MDGIARLVGRTELFRLWRRADRGWRHGRQLAARRIWRRAVRAARSLNCVAQLFDQPHGLSSTPPRFSPRASRSSALVVYVHGTRVRTDRSVVDGLIRTFGAGLVVDTTRQTARIAGREVLLAGRRLQLDILSELILAHGGPVAAEQLFSRVWKRRYNGEFDRSAMDYHFTRLRRMTSPDGLAGPLVTSRNGEYLLAPGLRSMLVEPAYQEPPVEERRDVARLLRDRRVIDNRGYRELCGVSRVTAMRQLRALVASGVLVSTGRGRGARYHAVDPAGDPSEPSSRSVTVR